MNTSTQNARLYSLDALRGFDMFWIIGGDYLVTHLAKATNLGFLNALSIQMEHVYWEGFHFEDQIMPLFLFMVGMSIPFSINKRKTLGESNSKIVLHALKRSVILFIFGGMSQCHYLSLDLSKMFFMHDTLQSIAVGYFVSILFYIKLNTKWQIGITSFLLLSFWAIIYLIPVPGNTAGICTPEVNTVSYFEHWLLGSFDDAHSHYTWVLSSLGFITTVMTGVFASRIIMSDNLRVTFLKFQNQMTSKAALLGLVGAILVGLGLIIDLVYPIVKHIWNPTFVIFSSGLSFLLIALFYYIIDVKGYKRWSFWLKVIGMNSIAVYMATHFIDFESIANKVLFGLEQFANEYYPFIKSVAGLVLIYTIMYWMYKKGTFIKV